MHPSQRWRRTMRVDAIARAFSRFPPHSLCGLLFRRFSISQRAGRTLLFSSESRLKAATWKGLDWKASSPPLCLFSPRSIPEKGDAFEKCVEGTLSNLFRVSCCTRCISHTWKKYHFVRRQMRGKSLLTHLPIQSPSSVDDDANFCRRPPFPFPLFCRLRKKSSFLPLEFLLISCLRWPKRQT